MSAALPALDLAPIRAARGVVALPGSKSVSIRALLLAALAEGETRLTGVLDADDTRVMRQALTACGVAMVDEGALGLRVRGAMQFPQRKADLFVGNSGLSIRTLVAVLAFMDGDYRLSGVPRMHQRPIADLVDALTPLGARVAYEAQPGFPPLVIAPAQSRAAQPVPSTTMPLRMTRSKRADMGISGLRHEAPSLGSPGSSVNAPAAAIAMDRPRDTRRW